MVGNSFKLVLYQTLNLVKSDIVFLFKPFLFVSCYPHGTVSGSDLNVHSESVTFLNKLKLNLSACLNH